MDGMAWTQAVELLESMGETSRKWGPLAGFIGRNKPGDGIYLPVLAQLPTVTHVSRSAFFSGKPTKPGRALRTTDDPKRWAEHTKVKNFVPPRQVPELLLQETGHNRDGTISERALRLIARREERVVALVLNVIDDALKGNPQKEHEWNVQSIRSLPALMDAAEGHNRVILFASDHGHVAGDLLSWTGKRSEGGSRWRPYKAGDEFNEEFEVLVTSNQAWRPRGTDGVVLLADDRHNYSSVKRAGEHGGATLAEVVTPCVLVGRDNMEISARGQGKLQVVSHHRPAWWFLDARPATEPPGPRRSPTKTGSRKRTDDQTLLLPIEPKAKLVVSTPPQHHPLALQLAEHPEFQGRTESQSKLREQVLRAVSYLLLRDGISPKQAFAASLNLKSWRVDQVIARYAEVLNLDGYPIVRVDTRAGQVVLERDQLVQQYELTEPS